MRHRLRMLWWVPLPVVVVGLDWLGFVPGLPADPTDRHLRYAIAAAVLLSVRMAALMGKVQHLEHRHGRTRDSAWLPDHMAWQWWVAAPLWGLVTPGTVSSFAALLWCAFLLHDFLALPAGWEPLRESVSRFRPALSAAPE